MSDFKERLKVEHNDLVVRGNKLQEFLWGDVFNSLHTKDKELLIQQLFLMRAYQDILAERIIRS